VCIGEEDGEVKKWKMKRGGVEMMRGAGGV
jgi:hypothetical protein